jgi:hypothetical protein
MAYKIPNKEIKRGVVQAYWLTQNTCNAPDGFMDSYKYPTAWAGCPGDGNTSGGHPKQKSCTVTGQIPEEFFNCADVRVSASGSFKPDSSASTASGSGTGADKDNATTAAATSESSNGSATYKTTVAPVVLAVSYPTETTKPASGGKKHVMKQVARPPKVSSSTAGTTDCAVDKSNGSMPGNSGKQLVNDTCAVRWAQCGGFEYSGPTQCCDPRFTCVMLNPKFYQCKAPPAPSPGPGMP